MKLIEIVNDLKNINQTLELINKKLPDVEYDLVDLYLEDNLDMYSEVHFLNAEEIPNDILIEINGKKLINLFPLNLTQEIISGYYNSNKNFTNQELSQKLLEYRIKDA